MTFFTGINTPIPGSRNPVGYITGLTAAWASTTTLTLAVGACSDSTNDIDMTVATAITINAAVNGAAGLDTGSLAASTFYYVYVIADSSGYTHALPSAVISAAAPTATTGPLMPYGYDTWRMVDIKVTDGSSHFLLTYTNGQYSYREFIYDAPLTTGSSALTTSYVALPLTACVAPIGTPDVNFVATFTPNAAGHIAYLQPTGSTGNEAEMSGVVAAVAQVMDIECTAFIVSGVPSISLKATAATDTLVLLVKSFTYRV
jgi:hypothetical protein